MTRSYPEGMLAHASCTPADPAGDVKKEVKRVRDQGSMTRIEYKVELMVFHVDEEVSRAEFLAQLNELGKEGWRLVAVNPLQRTVGGMEPTKAIPMVLYREVTDAVAS